MIGAGMNLITTVIGFGLSATFIVFVCTRIICGRLRGVESRPIFEIESRIDLEQVSAVFVPLTSYFTVSRNELVGVRVNDMELSSAMIQVVEHCLVKAPENQTVGLEPVLVAAIPTMKFDRDAFSSIEDAQCSICLGEYQEKEVLRIMPKCGHNFHLSCIDEWLRKQPTCPVCRLPLQSIPKTKHDSPDQTNGSETSIVDDHSRQWLLPQSVSGDSLEAIGSVVAELR